MTQFSCRRMIVLAVGACMACSSDDSGPRKGAIGGLGAQGNGASDTAGSDLSAEGAAPNTGSTCVDTRDEAASTGTTPLGITVQEARDRVRGAYPATLIWADGSSTSLEVTVTDLEGSFVRSRPAQSEINIGGQCPDSLVVRSNISLVTADGRLGEQLNVTFRSTDGTNFNAITPGIPAGELAGGYVFSGHGKCLVDVNFAVHVGADGISGSVLEQVSSDACDSTDDDSAISESVGGTW